MNVSRGHKLRPSSSWQSRWMMLLGRAPRLFGASIPFERRSPVRKQCSSFSETQIHTNTSKKIMRSNISVRRDDGLPGATTTLKISVLNTYVPNSPGRKTAELESIDHKQESQGQPWGRLRKYSDQGYPNREHVQEGHALTRYIAVLGESSSLLESVGSHVYLRYSLHLLTLNLLLLRSRFKERNTKLRSRSFKS